MNIDYRKSDLYFKHYLWTEDRREQVEAHDLDTQTLDILQGFEVLLFANTFLNLYLPDHTVADLHKLEVALADYVPHYITSKNHVAAYLAGHLYLIRQSRTMDKNTRPVLVKDQVRRLRQGNQ